MERKGLKVRLVRRVCRGRWGRLALTGRRVLRVLRANKAHRGFKACRVLPARTVLRVLKDRRGFKEFRGNRVRQGLKVRQEQLGRRDRRGLKVRRDLRVRMALLGRRGHREKKVTQEMRDLKDLPELMVQTALTEEPGFLVLVLLLIFQGVMVIFIWIFQRGLTTGQKLRGVGRGLGLFQS